MGPLAMARQRDRVEGYIAKGIEEGATLVTGGGRPKHLKRGYYIEPTVFSDVDNKHTIAQEEIFGPVLSRDPGRQRRARRSTSPTTPSTDSTPRCSPPTSRGPATSRADSLGHRGAQRHSASTYGIGFGGFKQSGIGREGGREGLLPYLEHKTVLLDGPPPGY